MSRLRVYLQRSITTIRSIRDKSSISAETNPTIYISVQQQVITVAVLQQQDWDTVRALLKRLPPTAKLCVYTIFSWMPYEFMSATL
jgi:hypothetical protein